MSEQPRKKSNARLAGILALVGLGMLGLGFAFVPLYETFCRLVGIPITQVGTDLKPAQRQNPELGVSDRTVTVRFIGTQDRNVPVKLKPSTPSIKLNIGQSTLMAYKATNEAPTDFTGLAVHQVIGHGKADQTDMLEYIDLEQCFCFDKQLYPANKMVNLPVSFSIRHSLPEGIHSMTFAYTLYPYDE